MSHSGELLWERLWTNMVKDIKTHSMFYNTFSLMRCGKILYRRTGHR